MSKIEETQKKLKEYGYFASEDLSKLVLLFENSGKQKKSSIPIMLLEGQSGAGKTFLAETFAKMSGASEKFVQCFPRMGTESFQYDVNIKGVLEQDSNNSVKDGILLQALKQSHEGPTVLVIDELDKARPEVDSFLLDFSENGRLTTGTDTYVKGEFPIYIFITSNNKREIDDALINRSRKVDVPRPSKELFLEILGLDSNHYLGYVYDKCPNFSIRQAKQYMEDLEVLGEEIDEDALSQYINLDELEVRSMADLEYFSSLESKDMDVELPNFERCRMHIENRNQDVMRNWIQLLQNSGEEFKIEFDESGMNTRTDRRGERVRYRDDYSVYIDVNSIQQLKKLKEYHILDENYYRGWFECEVNGEEDDIIWANNLPDQNGTQLGIKIQGDNMFRIAKNRDNTFVYLDSGNDLTLEQFIDEELKIENDYDIDDDDLAIS